MTFPEAAARQIARVLRLRPGEEIVVIPADCQDAVEWRVRLTQVEPRAVGGVVTAERAVLPEPDCAITLYPALLKGERFDWLLQKVTELGVAAVQPLLTQHTVRKVAANDHAVLERWKRIVTEAAEQSGRGRVPNVFAPVSMRAGLARAGHDLIAVGLPTPDAVSFGGLVQPHTRSIGVVIGPEGGFAEREIAEMTAEGRVQPVTLGPRILRAETAAIVAVTLALAAANNLRATPPRDWRPLDTYGIGA